MSDSIDEVFSEIEKMSDCGKKVEFTNHVAQKHYEKSTMRLGDKKVEVIKEFGVNTRYFINEIEEKFISDDYKIETKSITDFFCEEDISEEQI